MTTIKTDLVQSFKKVNEASEADYSSAVSGVFGDNNDNALIYVKGTTVKCKILVGDKWVTHNVTPVTPIGSQIKSRILACIKNYDGSLNIKIATLKKEGTGVNHIVISDVIFKKDNDKSPFIIGEETHFNNVTSDHGSDLESIQQFSFIINSIKNSKGIYDENNNIYFMKIKIKIAKARLFAFSKAALNPDIHDWVLHDINISNEQYEDAEAIVCSTPRDYFKQQDNPNNATWGEYFKWIFCSKDMACLSIRNVAVWDLKHTFSTAAATYAGYTELPMSIKSFSLCFIGKSYPCLHVFAIDSKKGRLHWLEQTDGTMEAKKGLFAPWRNVQTLIPDTHKILTCHPVVIDHTTVVLFTVTEQIGTAEQELCVLRYDHLSTRWTTQTPLLPKTITLYSKIEVLSVSSSRAPKSPSFPQVFVRVTEQNSAAPNPVTKLMRIYEETNKWEYADVK